MRKIRIKFLAQAREFVNSLSPKVQDKIYDVIHRVISGSKDPKIIKKLDRGDFYEIRVYCFPNQYRIFAFWDRDEDSLIVATHGIVKKYQKLKNADFKQMEQIRREYYNTKYK